MSGLRSFDLDRASRVMMAKEGLSNKGIEEIEVIRYERTRLVNGRQSIFGAVLLKPTSDGVCGSAVGMMAVDTCLLE